MKKYRIKQYTSLLGNIRYGIDQRFLLIFWIPGESFNNKEEAIEYYNKITEKIILQ